MRQYSRPDNLQKVSNIECTKLDDWRTSKGWSYDKMAKFLRVSMISVRRWCNGQTIPSLPMAFWIEYRTKGGMPVVAWLNTQIGKAEFNHYLKEGTPDGNEEGQAALP